MGGGVVSLLSLGGAATCRSLSVIALVSLRGCPAPTCEAVPPRVGSGVSTLGYVTYANLQTCCCCRIICVRFLVKLYESVCRVRHVDCTTNSIIIFLLLTYLSQYLIDSECIRNVSHCFCVNV